ncbi:MAG: SGNH/GDSL hydrolase family protein [Bdellovibrionales bacterium]|nr:SGNH/GDSL hydrolase family protein [Bdellovibrionales bacterium]
MGYITEAKRSLATIAVLKTGLSLILAVLPLSFAVPAEGQACPKVAGLIDPDCNGFIRFAITGDSIVKGIGDLHIDDRGEPIGYPGLIERRVNLPEFRTLNIGDPGATPRSLLRGFVRYIDKGRITTRKTTDIDYFLIQVGTNSYWDYNRDPARNTPAQVATQIVRLRKWIIKNLGLRNGYEPIVFTAQVPLTNREYQNPFIRELNSHILRLKKKLNVRVDFSRIPTSVLMLGDDLHPSNYRPMAALAQRALFGPIQVEARKRFVDEDHDGLYDETEPSKFFTDPTLLDTDGDGLSDGEEVLEFETDANAPDTDHDGIDDGVEVTNGTDPLDAESF